MPLTIITTNSSTTGVNRTVSGAGDSLHLLPNVLLASTGNTAIYATAQDVSLYLDGIVTAEDIAVQTSAAGANVMVGATGLLTAEAVSFPEAGVVLDGGQSTLTNHGTIRTDGEIGARLIRGGNEVFNSGTIIGTSGIVFAVTASGESGDRLYNSGEILAPEYYGPSFVTYVRAPGVGVNFYSSEGQLTNAAGGRIVSQAVDGAGVLASFGASGLAVENHGEIIASHGIGVDFSLLASGGAATLVNTGVVSGGVLSFDGAPAADRVTNSGRMIGDVVLGDGADRYDGRGSGAVIGSVSGDAGNDTLLGGPEDDHFLGGEGADTLRGAGGNDSLDGGGGSVVTIYGGTGDDSLNSGSSAFSYLFGGAGDDIILATGSTAGTLKGGAGDDRILTSGHTAHGGAGDDLVQHLGAGGGATLNGGSGEDTVSGRNSGDILRGQGDDDWLRGFGGGDTLKGGPGEDTLEGGDGNDLMFGGTGADTLEGEAGADTMNGGQDDDLLNGGAGADNLRGGAGDDSLLGEEGVDFLDGGAGDDWLEGGLFNDTLSGGRGDDSLTGDAGADLFVYRRGDDLDLVADFVDGQDRIDLRSWGFVNFIDVQNQHDVSDTMDGVRFDFGGGDVLVVNGATIATLSFPDFLF